MTKFHKRELKGYTTSRKGDILEIIACGILLKDEYEVFRNISSTGLIDIIAIKDSTTLFLDVKMLSPYLKSQAELFSAF